MSKKLIVGVDIRDLRVAQTGTRTYLEEICRQFKKMENADLEFYFFDTLLPIYKGTDKFLKLIEHIRYHAWKQIILPFKALLKSCDIVFCTDNFVPLVHLGYKTVPVFHDAFVLENPEDYSGFWLRLYHSLAIPAAKRSPAVVTPTNYAKQQINKHTEIPLDKLRVVYEGPKTLKTDCNAADDSFLKSLDINPGGYVLHVGSMYKRKNIPSLIHAFAIVHKKHADLKLVLAGPTPVNKFGDIDYHAILDAIAASGCEKDIILTGRVTDPQLAVLYSNALFYIFPSYNEGFGIPILEAFRFGLPVAAANNTSLPEVGGHALLLFDPFSVTDISEKIELLATDHKLREQLAAKGKMRLENFSWEKTATQLIELFRKVA